jgi:hypothetical protein
MTQDDPPAEEPTTGDRTQTERLASAAERARIGSGGDDVTGKPADADDATDRADKTDMGAVGDDGQVFGG